MKKVKEKALSMMVKALNTWRNTANKIKDEDFQTIIKTRWPHIDEKHWAKFIESHTDPEFKKRSAWGKDMRSKITMNHKLGSRGYNGKKNVWAKEDATTHNAGKDPPFYYLKEGRGKDFVRARSQFDPVALESFFQSKEAMDVHDNLVSS